jgi:pimeloyl-ACP methyl ester carboxylesterase
MLVIQGLEDHIAVPENGRSLAEDYPDRVRLVEVEGAGHGVAFERPDVVITAVSEFLEEVEGRRAADE